jgi:hypothetical protein
MKLTLARTRDTGDLYYCTGEFRCGISALMIYLRGVKWAHPWSRLENPRAAVVAEDMCLIPKTPGEWSILEATSEFAHSIGRDDSGMELRYQVHSPDRTCPQCQGLKQAAEATCRWESCEKAEDATEAR